MLTITKKLKLIVYGLVCSILTGIVIVTFALMTPLGSLVDRLDRAFYPYFFTSNLKPVPNLVVIDRKSSLPDRAGIAEMIRALGNAGATCIACDFYFTGATENNPAVDSLLVEGVRATPRVVLAVDFAKGQVPPSTQTSLAEKFALPDSTCEKVFVIKNTAGEVANFPFEGLLAVAGGLGHINTVQNEIEQFPPVIVFNNACYLGLPLRIASIARQAEGLTLPLAAIPLNKNGRILVNFIPVELFKPSPLPWRDAKKLLAQNSDEFADAIVLLVNSSGESPVRTPIDDLYPRWALLASVISQLIQDKNIEASGYFLPFVFSSMVVVAGLLGLLFVVPRLARKWHKTRYVYWAGNLVLVLLIFYCLSQWQTWTGVFWPVAAFNASLTIVRSKYYQMIEAACTEYGDFELAILERIGNHYPVQIASSPGGQEEGNTRFAYFLNDDDFVERLQRLRKLDVEEDGAKFVGGRLFDAAFQPLILSALEHSLEQLKRQNKYLRLRLRIDAPELVRLPWELTYSSKLTPSFIALHKRISLTRFLPLHQSFSRAAFRLPLKILVAVADPADLIKLDVQTEIQLIKKSLRLLRLGGDVSLRVRNHITLEKLAEALKWKPDVLHYIGHGHFDDAKNKAYLSLESDAGESHAVESEAIGALLHETMVRLVVLNSCEGATAADHDAFTGIAQNLIRAGVPAVVAMQYSIPDTTGLLFARIFYSTLIDSLSVDTAVAVARQTISRAAGWTSIDWAMPVLFMRRQGDSVFDVSRSAV